MANVNHSTLTDPYLHEPKGIAAAGAGTVYVANGSGSGAWTENNRFLGAYIAFDSATPETISVTTSDAVVDETFTLSHANGFSIETSPNTRFKYTGSENITGTLTVSLSVKQSSGSSKDVEWALFKNGTELTGSRVVRTQGTSTWGSVSLLGHTPLVTNDYVEIKVKADASCTVEVASAYILIDGVPS